MARLKLAIDTVSVTKMFFFILLCTGKRWLILRTIYYQAKKRINLRRRANSLVFAHAGSRRILYQWDSLTNCKQITFFTSLLDFYSTKTFSKVLLADLQCSQWLTKRCLRNCWTVVAWKVGDVWKWILGYRYWMMIYRRRVTRVLFFTLAKRQERSLIATTIKIDTAREWRYCSKNCIALLTWSSRKRVSGSMKWEFL